MSTPPRALILTTAKVTISFTKRGSKRMRQAVRTTVFVLIGIVAGLLISWSAWEQPAQHWPMIAAAVFLGAVAGGALSLPIRSTRSAAGAGLKAKAIEDSDHGASEPSLTSSRFARASLPRSLDDFRKQHVDGLKESPPGQMVGAINAAVVEEVAPFSVAKLIGVEPGDLLAQVDDYAGAGVKWEWLNNPSVRYTYRFHRRSIRKTWRATVSGIPLGLKLGATEARLTAIAENNSATFEDLEELWSRGQWPLLQRAAESALRRLGMPSLAPGVNVWLGAALYEQGHHAQACALLDDYFQNHSHEFVMSFRAVAAYYLARDAIQQGEVEHGEDLLFEAYEGWDHERFADALEQQTGDRPAKEADPYVGQQIAFDYRLRPIDSPEAERVSLKTALDELSSHQVMTLCLLGGYLANGPYVQFMQSYRRWFTFFPHYFAALHVVTANLAKETPADWLEAEQQAQACGVPMQVLFDSVGTVARQVGAQFSPLVLFLDGNANVLASRRLDEIELWKLIEQLAART